MSFPPDEADFARPEETALGPSDRAVETPPVATAPPVETRAFERKGDGSASDASAPPLLRSEDVESLRARWNVIQGAFVDEPRHAVEQADSLVAEAIRHLTEVFVEERSNLERQWGSGEDISTEDLRMALRRYRSFFTRLLSV